MRRPHSLSLPLKHCSQILFPQIASLTFNVIPSSSFDLLATPFSLFLSLSRALSVIPFSLFFSPFSLILQGVRTTACARSNPFTQEAPIAEVARCAAAALAPVHKCALGSIVKCEVPVHM